MNLKTVSNENLIIQTERCVKEEREILIRILHHLREIDRRRLFSSLGYKSLFDFAVKRLGYPEDQAYRRIAAMKLLTEIPEIEDKISHGEITLTHINLAQSLFRQENKIQKKPMSHEQKISVINKISNKSVREAERITLSLSSEPKTVKVDRVSAISETQIEMKFAASYEIREKVEKLKGMFAHTHPNMTLGELFEKLCDLGLSEWNLSKVSAPRKRRVSDLQSSSKAQVRRDVFAKADNKCENCGSIYALEVDHIEPQAIGGSSAAENLRLLCRSCNQRAAIEIFGLSKMDKHLNHIENQSY